MDFHPEKLLADLPEQAPRGGYWVAFSGGLDSTVLLHALAQLRSSLGTSLGAVHVHHGLQAVADQWVDHCQSFCARQHIPLKQLQADARPDPGESPEARARLARYRAFQHWLPEGAVLLSAHHQDDQAETLLLQLLRGAGPKGMSAMPREAPLGQGRLLRPLLAWSRSQLQDYACKTGLQWVEDPSNDNTRFDRNFLRHEILPRLQSRWPASARVLARSAGLCAEAVNLQHQLGEQDLAHCSGHLPDSLDIQAMHGLTPQRQRNLLRLWLQQQGFSLPSRRVLQRIPDEMLYSREDAQPCVHWPGTEVRRFQGQLLVMSPLGSKTMPCISPWDPQQTPRLDFDHGCLQALPALGGGLRRDLLQPYVVRARQGGERLRLPGRDHHSSLKQLFQAAGVPPWERERWPLIYLDDELAAVPGLVIAKGYCAGEQQTGWDLRWSRWWGGNRV